MITCNVFVKAGFLSIRLEFFLFKGCLTLFYVLPTDSNDQLFAGYMDRPEQVRNNLLFGENLDLEGEGAENDNSGGTGLYGGTRSIRFSCPGLCTFAKPYSLTGCAPFIQSFANLDLIFHGE